MKLVIKNAKLSKDHFPHVEVYIKGKPEEAQLIEKIDDLIGKELTGHSYTSEETGLEVNETWRMMASTDCAEYQDGEGIVWFFDKDYLDDFKELFIKHKQN